MLQFLSKLEPADRNIVQNALGDRSDLVGWPDKFTCLFLEAGLAYYPSEEEDEQGDMVLVRKPAMDKMRDTFVGKPVVNEVHQDATPENFNKIADGVVTRVWHDAMDGWDYCDVIVWDEATKKNMRGGAYSVSCAYKPTEVDPQGGEHHNVKYTAEILNGEYTHLAVVRNPRYEGARIIMNSKGGRTMKLCFWQKDKKNSKELDLESTVEIDGKKVLLKDIINAHKVKKNECDTAEIRDDTVIEIDGEEMPFSNLKEEYRTMKKNQADGEKDKADEEKKKKENEEKEKEEKEKKENEEKEKADKEKAEKEKENAKKVAADKVKSEELKNARFKGQPSAVPTLVTKGERVAEGSKRYGSK